MRFCRLDITASIWLGEPISFCCSTDSASRPVLASVATASLSSRLAARISVRALVGDLARRPASAAARGSSTSLRHEAQPQGLGAVEYAARVVSLRTTSSRARWRMSCVPATIGHQAPLDFHHREARRSRNGVMSAPSAIWKPPNATPCTAAITGTGRSRHSQAHCCGRLVDAVRARHEIARAGHTGAVVLHGGEAAHVESGAEGAALARQHHGTQALQPGELAPPR